MPASDGQQKLREMWGTLQKILNHELRSGCSDRVVIGGLEKFLSNWTTSISSMENAYPTWPEAKQLATILRGYGRLEVAERRVAALDALTVAKEVSNRLVTLPAVSSKKPVEGGLPPAGSLEPLVFGSMPAGVQRSGRGAATPPKAGKGGNGAAGPSGAEGKPKAPRMAARPAVPAKPRPRASQQAGLSLDDPVVTMRGVGKARAGKLAKLGIERVRDLLFHFPRDYRDYRLIKPIVELMYGETASIVGTVEDVQVMPGPKQRFRTTVKVRDASGRISATWFRYGYGGLKVTLNSRIALSGTVAGYGSHLNFEGPDWEAADNPPLHTRRLVPVYPLTEGVSDYWLRDVMADIVPALAPRLQEYLPDWLVESQSLLPYAEAVETVHFPSTPEAAARARERLAFDELFLIQLAALKRRSDWQSSANAPVLPVQDAILDQFLACQPFALTGAQRRVVDEIRGDMERRLPMTRLLQGDVGSGKTIVAAAAMLGVLAGGAQAALMAPTEILAEQHARTLRVVFDNAGDLLSGLLDRPLRLELLTGATKRSERERIYQEAAEGEIDVVVGTQAIVQEGFGFARLGLAIVDEQHRFGVVQRSALRQKGGTPHLLVMTATPIPRTLALAMYGDLDLSVIDEMPPGRQVVKTHLLGPTERHHAYEKIRREVASGRQAFIICPLVEDSPNLEARAATAEYERLQNGDLSELRLALLHGRMKPAEKDQIMRDFSAGAYDVLVSTSVVEVGIDVPNATVMLIEGADRFGLAQLHQFRGRVGRGQHPSTCVLLTDSQDEASLERLKVVVAESDGLRLADEDLRLRGPGEYFGLRQSGFPDLQMADLQDGRLVERARQAAAELVKRDPELSDPRMAPIVRRMEELRRAGSA